MKFKFILNENNSTTPKFILNERFILNEATNSEIMISWWNKLIETLKPIKEWLTFEINFINKELQQAANNIESAGEEIIKATELATLPEDFSTTISNYVTKLKDFINSNNKYSNSKIKTNLSKSIVELEKHTLQIDPKKLGTLPSLIKSIDQDLVKQYGLLGSDPGYENQRATLENQQKIAKDLLKTFDDYNEKKFIKEKDSIANISSDILNSYSTTLKTAIPKIEGLKLARPETPDFKVEKSTIGQFIKQTTNLNNLLTPLKTDLTKMWNGIKNTKKDTSELDDKSWTLKYKNAVNKDTVWETYLIKEWKNKVDAPKYDKLLDIQKTFRIECGYYGFEESSNKFIPFIRDYYLESSMPAVIYNVLHNWVAKNKLNPSDLVTGGKMEKHNLIFCDNFSSQSAATAESYLTKQVTLLNGGINKNTICAILYKDVEINKEDKNKITLPAENSKGWTLNTIEEMNNREKLLTGTVTSTEISDPYEKVKLNFSGTEDINKLIEVTAALIITRGIKVDTNNLPKEVQAKIKEYRENTTGIDLTQIINTYNSKLSSTTKPDATTNVNELIKQISSRKKPEEQGN